MQILTIQNVLTNRRILCDIYKSWDFDQRGPLDVKFLSDCQWKLFENQRMLKPLDNASVDLHSLIEVVQSTQELDVLIGDDFCVEQSDKGKGKKQYVEKMTEEVFHALVQSILSLPVNAALSLHDKALLIPKEYEALFDLHAISQLFEDPSLCFELVFNFRAFVYSMPERCFAFDSLGNLWFRFSMAADQNLRTRVYTLDLNSLPILEKLSGCIEENPNVDWEFSCEYISPTKENLSKIFDDFNRTRKVADVYPGLLPKFVGLDEVNEPIGLGQLSAGQSFGLNQSEAAQRYSLFAPVIDGWMLQQAFATNISSQISEVYANSHTINSKKVIPFKDLEDKLNQYVNKFAVKNEELALICHLQNESYAYSVILVIKNRDISNALFMLFGDDINELKSVLSHELKGEKACFYRLNTLEEVRKINLKSHDIFTPTGSDQELDDVLAAMYGVD